MVNSRNLCINYGKIFVMTIATAIASSNSLGTGL